MIKLANISKKYKDKIIFNDLNLTLEDEKFIALVGQSGSGKTTLLNILGGLDLKYDGQYEIIIDNDIKNMKDIDYQEKYRLDYFSYIFQDFNLINYLSVYDNIVLPLKYQKKKIDNEKIESTCKELGIYELISKKVKYLSGGEKQRVSIARCLLLDTKYILADEPTGSLDYDNTIKTIEMLKNIVKTHNKTVIVVTHNLFVLDYFDEVYEVVNNDVIPYHKG